MKTHILERYLSTELCGKCMSTVNVTESERQCLLNPSLQPTVARARRGSTIIGGETERSVGNDDERSVGCGGGRRE
jgi:hypothetical protein